MSDNYPHRRSVRLQDYDYSQSGLYFVTICTRDKTHWFGKISDNEIQLSDYGKIAEQCWLETINIRPNITLGDFIVMPNHIHAVFAIDNPIGRGVLNTPDLDARVLDTPYPSDTGLCNKPLQSPSQSVGAIVRGYKSMVTRQIGFSVWQRNYHEHIIRTDAALQQISNYIISNPARWQDDCYYDE